MNVMMMRICHCRWHSARIYDVKTKMGGTFGTTRLPQELVHDANNGLDIAVRLLEPINLFFPILSCTDFYQITFNYLLCLFFLAVIVSNGSIRL